MEKQTGKFLTLYHEWHKTGLPNGWGLCNQFYRDSYAEDLLELVGPTEGDFKSLRRQGLNTEYWASDSADEELGIFTPLRQNLVLLMAALNNEL